MADYYGQCRSNYFQVKSGERFRAFCKRYGLEVIESAEEKPKQKWVGFMVDGSIPNGRMNAKGDWIDSDFLGELSRQLADNQVAVVMEIGAEKMRYFVGYACAVDSNGGRIEVSINDIYRRAKEAFGVEPTQAEY